MITSQHIRRFSHKMHSAKDYIISLGLFRADTGKFKRISPRICKFDYFILLIVMAGNKQFFSESGFNFPDSPFHLTLGKITVSFRKCKSRILC